MSTKKVVPMLLAASVLMTGFTGAFLYSNNAAYGITSVDELTDVDHNSWAFDALRDLVEKYNVIEGYPDKTFRGDHTASRYEMAAALNALIRHVGKDIARLGAEKADKEDLAKLAKLQEEFKAELAALQARTSALEDRASKIEAKNEEQDNRLSVLEKLKIYGDVTFGGYADIGDRGGDGSPLPYQGGYAYGPLGVPNVNTYARVKSNATEGFSNAISALGRVRINVDYPIVEDPDGEGIVGPGKIHTRLVAAFGRVSPLLSQSDALRTTTGAGLLSGVSKIAGDASAFNEGIRTSNLQTGVGNRLSNFFVNGLGIAPGAATSSNVVTGSDVRANVYVDSAYYTQEFRSGIPILTDLLPGVDVLPDDENWKTSMKMHMGLIPWRDIFQKSPYTGNEVQQFQNCALLNNAAIPVNINAPTVALEWHQGLGKWTSLDVRTGFSAMDVSDAMSALAITYEGSINYNFGWLADWLDNPGNIYAGGFVINSRSGSNSLVTTATGYNSNQILSTEGFAFGLANSPANFFANQFAVSGKAGGNFGTLFANQNAVVTTNVLRDISTNMGLPGTALTSPAALAAALGINQSQLTNLNTVLPTQTLLNIAANQPLIARAIPAGTTLGAYYNQLLAQFGALGVPAGGLGLTLPGTFNNPGLPAGGNAYGVDTNDNVVGFYAGINQQIHRNAGFFFSYGVMDTGPMSMLTSALQDGTGRNMIYNFASGNLNGNIYGVKSAINGGLEIPLKALHMPWREKDVIGVGYARILPNNALGSSYNGTTFGYGSVLSQQWYNPTVATFNPVTGNWVYPQPAGGLIGASCSEQIVEAYYKVHINDRFSITPNAQFIINRLGDPNNKLMTVLGLRTSFTF